MQKNTIEIIHEDKDLIVINKPAGISVTADRSGKDDILTVLARQLSAETDLRLIHRLDKFTSGVMLIAKNLPTQSKYSSMLEKRLIKKTYLALASEDMPLVRDPLYSATRPVMLSDVKAKYRQKKDQPEKPLMDRLTLHAYQIEIPTGDTDSQPAVYTAKLDNKFVATIKMLAKHNPNGPEAFKDPELLQKILAVKTI